MFHLIGKQLKINTTTQNLEHETYTKCNREAKKTVLTFSEDTINRTNKSMPKGIDQVIKVKGQCNMC